MTFFKITKIFGCEERGDYDRPYLTRLTIIECKYFKFALHIFHASDHEDHHDHPWNFITFILWRGYIEETPTGKKRKWPGMVLYRPATFRHRVELVKERPAVTLVIMGKRWREWGFFEKTTGRWIQWARYFIKNKC